MTALTWDQPGQRVYETGVEHGVLYIPDSTGAYSQGYAWNGLTTVTESPSGAESNPQYADNITYLNLISAEVFGCTIEAFTFPDAFAQCDGSIQPMPGVNVTQQGRQTFGLKYRSRVGNDLKGADYGSKLHLVYGCTAAPSEKAYATINDSPEGIAFSWDVTTSPVDVPGYKPSALMVIDSTKVSPAALTTLLSILHGTTGTSARLPLPAEVFSIFAGSTTAVRMTGANAPTYNSSTHVVTLPAVTGVVWRVNGVIVNSGAQPAMTVGQSSQVTATASQGYVLQGDDDWTYDY